MHHYVKVWPEFFAPLDSGAKPFEVRNDDRNYAVGDVLFLQEYEPMTQIYTGAVAVRRVTYVLRNYPHVEKGFVVLGLDNPQR